MGAFRNAYEPAVVERLGNVDDVSWKQVQLVVVARTVRLHRTVRRRRDDAAVDVITAIQRRQNDVTGVTRPRGRPNDVTGVTQPRGRPTRSALDERVAVAVQCHRRRTGQVVASPRICFRRGFVDSMLAVGGAYRTTTTADRKRFDDVVGGHGRRVVEDLMAAVCGRRRRNSTSSGVVADVDGRTVDIILVVGRRREVGRRTFTGAVGGGGGGGVQTGGTELTRQRAAS